VANTIHGAKPKEMVLVTDLDALGAFPPWVHHSSSSCPFADEDENAVRAREDAQRGKACGPAWITPVEPTSAPD
jgi:hypothetical protein